jgi:hypothetical protein
MYNIFETFYQSDTGPPGYRSFARLRLEDFRTFEKVAAREKVAYYVSRFKRK